MRILFIHAHFDDYEFVAAGTFDLWKKKLGTDLRARVIVCTDGRSGHHERTREETAKLRLDEQHASARIGGYEFELLKKPNGEAFEEAARVLTTDLLAALWHSIRDFEPDYLFCPPFPVDPLAGVHPDHLTIAEAVRRVAYMISVPHAFLDEYPIADERKSKHIKTPVILNTYDAYMAGANACDLVVDIEPVFDRVAEMSWCHQSQISEWLPWIGRHQLEPPKDRDEWKIKLRERFRRQQRELGLPLDRALEVFTITAWGVIPSWEQLTRDFPSLAVDPDREKRVRERLRRWAG